MSDNYVTQEGKEIPFSDDESVRDDELITDGATLADPVEQKARAERRRERAAERERERKELQEKLKTFEERDAKRERELAELRGFVAGSRGTQEPGKDPYEARLDQVYEQQREAFRQYQAEIAAKTVTPEREKHYEQIARQLEMEKGQIHAERVVAQTEPRLWQSAAKQRWVEQYPDVYHHHQAYQYAEASYTRRRLLLQPGQMPTEDMAREAMEEARTAFKLGPRKAPSASERDRLSGLPSSGGGGGGGGGSGGVVMTKDLRKMATSLYSDLPEEEAVKKWTNTVGRSLREKKVL
jgi:hypothetical protein